MTALGRDIVNALLLGPNAHGRLVGDSPIRGDVWASFAAEPGKRIDVLIEAYRDTSTGLVAARLARRLYNGPDRPGFESPSAFEGYGVSFLEGFVAARLRLKELAYAVLPFTAWSAELRLPEEGASDQDTAARLRNSLSRHVRLQLIAMHSADNASRDALANATPAIARMAGTFRILAALLWIEELALESPIQTPSEFFRVADIDAIADLAGNLAFHTVRLRPGGGPDDAPSSIDERDQADIFAISRNRPVELAIERSIPAIKADAVSTLFGVSCAKIGWAVLDSGIDGDHPAFLDLARDDGRNRITATYDFTRLRKIVLIDHLYNTMLLDRHADDIAASYPNMDAQRVRDDLHMLAADARDERPINWGIAERYIKANAPAPPENPHGTHVAGILGGCWAPGHYVGGAPIAKRGVCPDIRLFDFRVVSASAEDTEFALVGALQFIRHINSRNNHPLIHGANISLSIQHDVRNYACGRTPVCEESERLVNSGVVVVVAAGNRGYQSYIVSGGGTFETYAPSSITDPGNAEAVITVGATHRSAPHSYGVSFFSSRGPTGDGRAKPDLVAPGEKIWSVVPGKTEDALSGTSMAAPHVSGAAAMLMARNAEFIGQAAQIKRILCASCTDLGRERAFQGAGMLDILRAMQSV